MNRGIAVICLLIFAAAIWTAVREAQPLVAEQASPMRLARVAAGDLAIGPSLELGRAAASECQWAIQSPVGVLQPRDVRQQILAGCEEVAARLRAEHPTLAMGYFLTAITAAENDDNSAMSAMLVASRHAMPQSQSMARMRLAFTEGKYDRLATAAQTSENEDLAVLLASQPGLEFLAPRYIADEAFRDRLRPILGTASPEYQARFLSLVQHLTEARN